jgi:hypothetical protein
MVDLNYVQYSDSVEQTLRKHFTAEGLLFERRPRTLWYQKNSIRYCFRTRS